MKRGIAVFSVFKNKNDSIVADYNAILALARNPALYTEYGVPDTPYGRFQMIALHAAPYYIRYIEEGRGRKGQRLFDMIFRDIEQSFRQIGIGDLSVPKKMKKYMQNFNGIVQGHAAENADHVEITKRNLSDEGEALSPAFESYIKGLFK